MRAHDSVLSVGSWAINGGLLDIDFMMRAMGVWEFTYITCLRCAFGEERLRFNRLVFNDFSMASANSVP